MAMSLLPVLVCLAAGTALAAAKAPNILILFTDDQGWADTGFNCHSNATVCPKTPNFDKLARSPHSAVFHRFYAAGGVCSPTRAAILTGRTNERDCIHSALPCDQENPAPTCAQGSAGALPWTEFTIGDAAKKSKLGNYSTLQVGKWHLGDLWDKKLPNMNRKWPVSSPTQAGFDHWWTTEAEASSSMSNCGCFPVNHSNPGPKPPSGYPKITPHGDQCVVGGGFFSDWCYPCTNYYYPNASDERLVTDLQEKIPGDDSVFIVDRFEDFLNQQVADDNPFLAHLCFHSIHEPHPSMPEFYHQYSLDPDYLGTLTQLDVQFGRVFDLLEKTGVINDTIVFFTTDNGPHQGAERTDIRWSTNYLRQCKASGFEGGIRVPGIMFAPMYIKANLNVTSPVGTLDILPTIMEVLQVETNNTDWVLDGLSLLPVVQGNGSTPRSKPLPFSWGGTSGVIDNDYKIVKDPGVGQCTLQAPYTSSSVRGTFLFNVVDDYHELHDLTTAEPAKFAEMSGLLTKLEASIAFSQVNETKCAVKPPPPPPSPPAPPSSACTWHPDSGLNGTDIAVVPAKTEEECCGACRAVAACKASDLNGGICHLKSEFTPKPRKGSTACVPTP